MFAIDSITKIIQAKTQVVPTVPLYCIAIWNDISVNGANVDIGPNQQVTGINNVLAPIVPTVVTNQKRNLTYVSIYNSNTETHHVSISLYNSSGPVTTPIHRVQLKPNYRAEYTVDDGWRLYDDLGDLVTGTQKTISGKIFAQGNPGAVLTDAFTATYKTKIESIFVANRAGVSKSFRLAFSPLGAAIANSHYTHYDYVIAKNDTLKIDTPIYLEATDIVRFYGQDNNVSFTITGTQEI